MLQEDHLRALPQIVMDKRAAGLRGTYQLRP